MPELGKELEGATKASLAGPTPPFEETRKGLRRGLGSPPPLNPQHQLAATQRFNR